MWLLLAAAGTGYLARCWQKARKRKSGSSVLKHNALSNVSQRSPSCTPRRGRSTTASRRGSRKRSQSAKSRKLLPGRSEGRLARNYARDWDENFGSFEKFFEELLLGDDDLFGQCIISSVKDQDTSGHVQTSSQVNKSHENNHMEPYLSLSSMCVQDQWRETSSCMEKPLLLTADIDAKEPLSCICGLSNKKPNFETLHGCSATALDFMENQLSMVASSSRNRLDCSKPMENSLIVSDLKSHASPSCLQIPRIKTTRESRRQNCVYKSKESTEQALGFFSKMARELGQRTYSTFSSKFSNRMGRRSFMNPGLLENPNKVPVCQSLSYGELWKDTPEKEQGLSLQRDKNKLNSCALHSYLLKALLDPEYLHRCNYLSLSIRGNDHENAVPCLIHHAGLSMAIDGKIIQNSGGESKTNHWKHSKGQSSGFTEPFNPCTNHLLGSNESSLIALGVAMGLAFVASGRNNELEDLQKLLRNTNSLIEELKKQMDSGFEFDPVKLIKVEKYGESVASKPTLPNGTCPWKAHQHSESNSGKSAAEISSLELFSADNNHAPNVLSENYVHGLNELEAELEAELQLMELNVCNPNPADYEWEQTQTQCNQESRQPEGDDGLYVDNDIHDSMAIQDAEQLYESDFVVPPLELERRLWQVLEQRHEERICELENDLHITNEKVTAKEVEVQWWKDRVWWLMETSLGGKNDNMQPLLFD